MRSLQHLPRAAVITVALAGSVGLAAAGISAASAATQHSGRIAVPNAQPKLTHAVRMGKATRSQRIDVKLYLATRHADQLDAVVKAISTPGGAGYGKYLTPASFRATYAPTAATVNSVRAFLKSYGLRVGSVSSNRSFVQASGTVAQVETAFGTELEQYRMAGSTVRAASSAATVPASLKGSVIAVSGLASMSSLMQPPHEDGPKIVEGVAGHTTVAPGKAGKGAPPPDAFVNAAPCSTYFQQKKATTVPKVYGSVPPYVTCGYVPAQLQSVYGLTSSLKAGFDGRGVTVAITDAYAAPTVLSDANTYATAHGQAAFAKGQFKQVLPTEPFRYGYDDTTADHDVCGEQGWYGEESLDVEAVHAVAPGAKVTYVAARSCDNSDLADALNTIVDKHLANIVTNSWGGTNESNGPPAELDQVYQQIFYQAALEGIGFYFSAGDSGDGAAHNGGVPTVDAPANSTLVTAVGGTSLAVGKKGQRLFETGWSTAKSSLNDKGAWAPSPPGAYLYGGGGGTSQVFAQPWYQQGVVPRALSERYSSQPARVVPDVSAVGDPNTGFLIGETQTFPDKSVKYSEYRIGGTSLASPVFAGIMAIADQVAGFPHGFANPALYGLYGSKALYDPKPVKNQGVVRVDYANTVDATDGLLTSLRSLDVTTGTILRTKKGYDDVTGVGSPNGASFFGALS